MWETNLVIFFTDGGEIRSASTPEGRYYYLVNNEGQWLYLERSTDERFQTLLLTFTCVFEFFGSQNEVFVRITCV
ncbi:hypothetical protein GCK32_015185 [Trichostrongylus colubriformis]|uniref:Uncharacterized protein n=1 Tax=Trichostrongylus colubriformis TaxID=6319 RepID=A0AAN8IRE7_TRICO